MYVPFFQLYGCIIDEQNCKIFKAHVMMTRYSIYCGRILPIQLTHLSSSPVCVCVCVVGASAHFNYTVQCCQPQSPCVYSSFGLYASYVSKFVPFYQPLFTSLFPTGPGSHFSAVSPRARLLLPRTALICDVFSVVSNIMFTFLFQAVVHTTCTFP